MQGKKHAPPSSQWGGRPTGYLSPLIILFAPLSACALPIGSQASPASLLSIPPHAGPPPLEIPSPSGAVTFQLGGEEDHEGASPSRTSGHSTDFPQTDMEDLGEWAGGLPPVGKGGRHLFTHGLASWSNVWSSQWHAAVGFAPRDVPTPLPPARPHTPVPSPPGLPQVGVCQR
jgi:hypothetical protein